MYTNLIHKNIGTDTAVDPEEGRCPSGEDITIRAFVSESRRINDICDAIRKALAQRHNIQQESANMRSRIEIAPEFSSSKGGKVTVYGNDATGKYDGVTVYNFEVEA